MKADIVVYDRNGQIVLIIKIKKRLGVSSEWAIKWRRNILSHGSLPDAKFFMTALPDRFYLWKNAGNLPELVEPTFEIDAKPILKLYFDESGTSPEKIAPQSFELIVGVWLNSLLLNQKNDAPKWIIQSGLSEALSGGHLDYEVVLCQ
ncbi:MAG: hypothetical protein GY749_38055 [Desulfobacteraceae bacterium]|nr:hypothetical protein [Desulfobacteraceae bacterium]